MVVRSRPAETELPTRHWAVSTDTCDHDVYYILRDPVPNRPAIAGAGALGSLAGCPSASSDEGDSTERDDSDVAEAETDDEPLIDYECTASPQIVDRADQEWESTLRTLPRHELVTEAGPDGPVEHPEVWA
jgi:hypothetical protein